MVTTAEAVAEAETRPELTPVATSGPWHIFEYADAAIVEPLDVQPVVVNGRDGDQRECFLEVGTSWFQHQDEWAAMPAVDGPDTWQRIDVAIDESRQEPQGQGTDECGDPQSSTSRRGEHRPAGAGDRRRRPPRGRGQQRRDRRAVRRVRRLRAGRAGARAGQLLPELDGPRCRGPVPHRSQPDGRRADRHARAAGVRAVQHRPVLLRVDRPRHRPGVFARFRDWNFPKLAAPTAREPPPPPTLAIAGCPGTDVETARVGLARSFRRGPTATRRRLPTSAPLAPALPAPSPTPDDQSGYWIT